MHLFMVSATKTHSRVLGFGISKHPAPVHLISKAEHFGDKVTVTMRKIEGEGGKKYSDRKRSLLKKLTKACLAMGALEDKSPYDLPQNRSRQAKQLYYYVSSPDHAFIVRTYRTDKNGVQPTNNGKTKTLDTVIKKTAAQHADVTEVTIEPYVQLPPPRFTVPKA